MHEFSNSLVIGDKHEIELDRFYSQWSKILRVSHTAQAMGIDRVWISNETGIQYTVEYKSDEIAGRTGNVFIETISNDVTGKLGWAYTTCAQWLCYYIPQMKTAYWIDALVLKYRIKEWEKKYKSISVANKDYNTIGILMPLDEFKHFCNCIQKVTSDNAIQQNSPL